MTYKEALQSIDPIEIIRTILIVIKNNTAL
jgi:hypothetical protein